MIRPQLLTLVLSIVLCSGCGYFLGPQRGILAIESPNGEKLYFHREVEGLNRDQLVLSTDSNYCSLDPARTIRFLTLQPTVFYRFEGNDLHLFFPGPIAVPPNFSDKVKVVQHEFEGTEYFPLIENDGYKKKGLELVDVQIDKSIFCYW